MEESIKVIPWFCTAHNIATSNGAVIFTCRLKRGNGMYGPFCSQNSFHSTRLKRCVLKLAAVPSRKRIIFPYVVVLR